MSSATSSFSPIPVPAPAVGRCAHEAYFHSPSYQTHQVVIDGDDIEQPSSMSLCNRSWSSSTTSPTLSAAPLDSSQTQQPPPNEESNLRPSPNDDVITQRLTFKSNPALVGPPVKNRRLSRCESEKLRRDRLNAYTGELAKIVPLVMQTNKKIDKASILRLTVTHLRIYQYLIGCRSKTPTSKWPLSSSNGSDLASILLSNLNGFLLVLNSDGVIIYVSEAVTSLLGHNLADILGCSVFNIVHDDDHKLLRRQLHQWPNDQLVHDNHDNKDDPVVRGQRSCYVRMQKVLEDQQTSYSTIHLVGHLRKMPVPNDSNSSEQTHASSTQRSGLCLIAIASLEENKLITEVYPNVSDSTQQWISRHELDGKITYSDQRGACLTGFLPGESMGLSAYSLVHPDDIPYIISLHNHALVTGEMRESVFRMYTKSRDILYISNNVYMVLDMWTKKAKFIISINDVLSEVEGKIRLETHRALVRGLSPDVVLPPQVDKVHLDSSPHDSAVATTPQSNCFEASQKVIEVGMSKLSVIIGEQQFVVDTSRTTQTFDSQSSQINGQSNPRVVFDPHASNEDGGRSVPLIQPVFLGSSTQSASCNMSVKSGSSCDVSPDAVDVNVPAAPCRNILLHEKQSTVSHTQIGADGLNRSDRLLRHLLTKRDNTAKQSRSLMNAPDHVNGSVRHSVQNATPVNGHKSTVSQPTNKGSSSEQPLPGIIIGSHPSRNECSSTQVPRARSESLSNGPAVPGHFNTGELRCPDKVIASNSSHVDYSSNRLDSRCKSLSTGQLAHQQHNVGVFTTSRPTVAGMNGSTNSLSGDVRLAGKTQGTFTDSRVSSVEQTKKTNSYHQQRYMSSYDDPLQWHMIPYNDYESSSYSSPLSYSRSKTNGFSVPNYAGQSSHWNNSSTMAYSIGFDTGVQTLNPAVMNDEMKGDILGGVNFMTSFDFDVNDTTIFDLVNV